MSNAPAKSVGGLEEVDESDPGKCPDDAIYMIRDDGFILWNDKAHELIETMMEHGSMEYWIAKHLWSYHCHLRSLN